VLLPAALLSLLSLKEQTTKTTNPCHALPLTSALSFSSSALASSLKAKAQAAINGAYSAVSTTTATATVADLDADMRYDASGYADPGAATPQDKVSGMQTHNAW
jgi:hypothetical protein